MICLTFFKVPRHDVTRSFFIMWVWYGLLLATVYRSSLTAFLTIPLSQAPIDTLHQVRQNDMTALKHNRVTKGGDRT